MPRAIQVTFSRTVQRRRYEPEKLEVVVELEGDDTVENAYAWAKMRVYELLGVDPATGAMVSRPERTEWTPPPTVDEAQRVIQSTRRRVNPNPLRPYHGDGNEPEDSEA
jgi:hypothetical protein